MSGLARSALNERYTVFGPSMVHVFCPDRDFFICARATPILPLGLPPFGCPAQGGILSNPLARPFRLTVEFALG